MAGEIGVAGGGGVVGFWSGGVTTRGGAAGAALLITTVHAAILGHGHGNDWCADTGRWSASVPQAGQILRR